MKVYILGQKGIPAKSGGVEAHVEELSKRLVKLGHEVNVYTRPNYTDPKLTMYKGVNLISVPNLSTKHLDAITASFRAIWDLRKRQVDVIHFHSIGPSSLILFARLVKPGVPIVATFHTRCYQHQKWGALAKAYLKFGELSACLFATRTITISKSLTSFAKTEYGVTTEYIPNGVTLPIIRPAKLIKQWGLEKDNYIVTISRLVRHKGVQYLIEAYQQLATDKKLVIVGAGSFTDDYVKELHALAKNNPNIIFTGNQSGEILGELFSNASLFVQPSESEGLSIALLEAMAYELPCLVSDIPENIEAVEAVGFAFRNKDVDDLKNKLKFLLEHQALAKTHGKLGRDRVKEHYSWLDIGTKVSWLYDQVVMAKRTAKGFKLVRKFFMLF